jgi:hypothetical protein
MTPTATLTGQGTTLSRGQARCTQHQQRLQQAQLQHSRRHFERHHRHHARRSTAQLTTQVVQTAERSAAADPGGTRPSIEERISAFDGRGIAVISPPLTDIQLPMLRDSRHKVLLAVTCLQFFTSKFGIRPWLLRPCAVHMILQTTYVTTTRLPEPLLLTLSAICHLRFVRDRNTTW